MVLNPSPYTHITAVNKIIMMGTSNGDGDGGDGDGGGGCGECGVDCDAIVVLVVVYDTH